MWVWGVTGWISIQPEGGGPSRSVRPTTIQPAPDNSKVPSEYELAGRVVHPQLLEPEEDQKVSTSPSPEFTVNVQVPPRRGRPPKRKKYDMNGERAIARNDGREKWAKRSATAPKTDRSSDAAQVATTKLSSEWVSQKHTEPLHNSTLAASSNDDDSSTIDVELVDGIPITAVEEHAWRATPLSGLERDHDGSFGNGGGSMTEFLSAQAAEIAKLENQLARVRAQLDARQAARQASEESVREAAAAVAVAAAAEAQEASAAVAARRAKKQKKVKANMDTVNDDCAAAELLRFFGGQSQNAAHVVPDAAPICAAPLGAHQAPENQSPLPLPRPHTELEGIQPSEEANETAALISSAGPSTAAALDALSEDVGANEDADRDEDADEDGAWNRTHENKGKGKRRRGMGEGFHSKSQRSTRKDATTCAWLAKLFVVLHRGQPPPAENDTNRAAALSNDTITATFAAAAQAAATAIATAAAHIGSSVHEGGCGSNDNGSSSSSTRDITARGSGEKGSASKCAAIAAQAAANATRKPGADLLESSALTAAVTAVAWCGSAEFDTLHWSSNGEAVSVTDFLVFLLIPQTLSLILSLSVLVLALHFSLPVSCFFFFRANIYVSISQLCF